MVALGTRMVALGTGMAWCWVLVVLGGVCALPAAPPYPQALAQALDTFNQRPEVQNVFRLLSADPEPGPEVQLSSLKHLNFSIMETRCPAHSGVRPDTCDFKEDGLLKDCWAPVPQRGQPIDVTCVDTTADPVKVKRFWPLVAVAWKVFRAIKKR